MVLPALPCKITPVQGTVRCAAAGMVEAVAAAGAAPLGQLPYAAVV